PIDLMSFSWGGVALSFDSADVDSVPVRSITDLSQYLGNISGPLGNVTGNIDLQKGRMTLLEPITIPGTGDAVLLITGNVQVSGNTGNASSINWGDGNKTSDDQWDNKDAMDKNGNGGSTGGDGTTVPSQTIANVVKLMHRGEITSLSDGGDNPAESRIKVQFHWDRQGKNDDKSSIDVRGWDPNNKQGVQYRETSFEFLADNAGSMNNGDNGKTKNTNMTDVFAFDAFYNIPSNQLPNNSGDGSFAFTSVVTGDGSGRLLPASPSPITLDCSMGMSKNMYDWIKQSINGESPRKYGAILPAPDNGNGGTQGDKEDKGNTHTGNMSGNHKDIMELAFTDAQITDVGFPALDASSKDPAMIAVKKQGYPNGPARPSMTVSITPGKTEWKIDSTGSAELLSPHSGHPTGKRQWNPVSFRLKIDGLDDACTRVVKVEKFSVKQSTMESAAGSAQGSALFFTIPSSDAKPFTDWYEHSLTTRKAGGTQQEDAMLTTRKAGEHPNGVLEYLSDDGSVLYSLNLHGITPVSIQQGTMHWVLEVRVQRVDMN
ncbi:MAG TPA: hypothetical protein VFA55_05065, partial [Candidatus Kapabacteria bacterium]|nr:hypothetical protein [Candidatus Kapabacteria bacterium]